MQGVQTHTFTVNVYGPRVSTPPAQTHANKRFFANAPLDSTSTTVPRNLTATTLPRNLPNPNTEPTLDQLAS